MSINKGISMKTKLAVLVNLALVTTQAFAVEPQSIQTESGYDITPLLSSSLKFDDNITSNSLEELDSWIMTVAPTIEARKDDGVSITEFNAGFTRGQYFSSSDDNYTDANLGGSFDTRLSEQSKLNVKADLLWGHEDRGTGINQGNGSVQADPTKFNSQNFVAYYDYAKESSPLGIRLNTRYFNKEYTNQEEVTQFRNYDSKLAGLNLYFDTLSGTRAVLETSIDDISYDVVDPAAPRDSKDVLVKAGAEWEISALTTGEAKIGYQQKDFDDALRENFNGIAWTVNIDWTPLTYSSINIGTGRRAKDPLQDGDYVKETSFALGWTHDWSETVQTNLNYNRVKEDYVGVVRTDDVNSYNFSVTYAFRRFIDVSLFTSVIDKTSTVPTIKFDRNIVGINFDFSL